MAVYKVAQDVEADDKLIGPFSFRQFIYLIIVAIGIALAWGLSRIFLPLLIIPVPIIIFFGALALPLRKDQPMEIYLAAIVSFYLKPRKRFWRPDGIESLIEITAPKVVEVQRTRDLSQTEAEKRLSYLATLVDSKGWAVRGVAAPEVDNSSIHSDIYFTAQQTEDVLEDTGRVAQNIDAMIDQTDQKYKQTLVDQMQTGTLAPTPSPPPTPAPPALSADTPRLSYNPYPTNMHQTILQPISQQHQTSTQTPSDFTKTPAPTSEDTPSPDIINLANNTDLSIATIAHEANRIHQKEAEENDEVVISLR